MTPEIEARFAALERQAEEQKRLWDGLMSLADMHPDVKRTLELVLTGASDKAADSEDQAVNEAGSGTYDVLKPPDRFIRIGDTNVPAYD